VERLSFDQELAIAGIVLGVLALLVGLGVTLGMDARTRGEFRFAVGCFILSACMLCCTVGVWQVATEIRWYQRFLISGCCFALIGVLLVEGIRWTHHRHLHARISIEPSHPAPAAPPSGADSHGTTDKVRAKVQPHGTGDSAAAKVGHPAQLAPTPSAPPAQSTIIQTQAPYGNLAARCGDLGDAIVRFVAQRNKERPDPSTHPDEYKDWFRLNDGLFRWYFYKDIKKIHQEMADVHIDDPRLDKLIEKHEEYYNSRQKDVKNAIAWPEGFHLSIEDIGEIGGRFKFLAGQIPH
jgi:hypothetical protein